MRDKLKGILIAVVAVAALAVGGAAIAGATGGGDDGSGKPITGPDLDKASAVALKQTGGGKVTGSEIRDEEGYYEVEVTRDDGKQVDVHLDKSFHVIASKADHEDGGGSKDDQ
jgi:uncharacterized membrane protein YkoI